MITGTLTAAFLLLTAAAPAAGIPADVALMKSTKFEIPINVAPGQRDNIARLELHCSRNGGKTWEQVGTATPDQSAFPYTAPADGMYWFTVLIVDRKGKLEPRTPYGAAPGLKVLVDTAPPEVNIVSAERKGDVVNVRWEAREEYPNLASFRLEYRPADGSSDWTAIPSTQALMGQATFRYAGPVSVRATLADMAQNVSVSREVKVAGAAVVTASAQTLESPGDSTPLAPPGGAPAVASQPPIAAPAAPQKGTGAGTGEIKPAPARETLPTPPPAGSGVGGRDSVPPPSELPPGSGGDGRTDTPANVVAASSGDPKKEPTSPTSPPAADRELGKEVVNNRRVTLEYEVSKFGPSGIGSVDLYMTQDDGLNWQRVEAEHGAAVPARPGEPMRRNLSVLLGQDGTYGFTLVVRSKAGQTSRPEPKAGEAPRMRLELDTKVPEAELYRPEPSPTQQDALVIQWKANDKNLGPRPISLEWAEQLRGEWKPIGDKQLANTGSHTWQLPQGIPAQVYLRLTVRDKGGNVAVAETKRPVLIDLVRPEAELRGVVRAGNP